MAVGSTEQELTVQRLAKWFYLFVRLALRPVLTPACTYRYCRYPPHRIDHLWPIPFENRLDRDGQARQSFDQVCSLDRAIYHSPWLARSGELTAEPLSRVNYLGQCSRSHSWYITDYTINHS